MAFWHPKLVRQLGQERSVITYDMRGHGRSDLPQSGYDSATLAADAIAVLDHFEVSQAEVVAHSFGATAALQLARLYPDRVQSLVLLDGRIRVLQPEVRLGQWSQFERWRKHFRENGLDLDPDLEIDFRLPLTIASEAWAAAREQLISDGFFAPANSKRAVEKYRRLLTETTAADELNDEAGLTPKSISRIPHSVQAVYGSYSPYLPTQKQLVKLLMDCGTDMIEGSGHNFPLIAPDLTLDAINRFWGSQKSDIIYPLDWYMI